MSEQSRTENSAQGALAEIYIKTTTGTLFNSIYNNKRSMTIQWCIYRELHSNGSQGADRRVVRAQLLEETSTPLGSTQTQEGIESLGFGVKTII